jgi:polysaccharide biosynthesis protein PslG
MSMVGKMRAWIAALAVSAVGLGALAATAEAVPVRFWGVVPQATPTFEQLQRLKRGGVDTVRTPVGWPEVQPVAGGPLNWAALDAIVKADTAAGLEVLPFLSGAPTWAVPVDRRFKSPANLPVRTGLQRTGWTNFVEQAVLRYGPNGSFWAANPGLPEHPIHTWQIWNEENFEYFVAHPNPAEYGKLVKLSYAAIKGVDPGAKIVLGGMFAKPNEATLKVKPPEAYFATDFLQQMYRTTPGIKSKFNGVALHPYSGSYLALAPDIEEVRAVLTKNHDSAKGIWITELGWSSQPPATDGSNSFAKGRSGQAAQLRGAFGLLSRNQVKWKIRRVFWFSVDDQTGACNFCDGSGLFGAGFVAKPAWKAYVKFAGGIP